MTKKYTKDNFHSHTFCLWKEVLMNEIKDFKINYTSQSGSQYIFKPEGLYRISNHWGRVANCHWRLVPISEFKNQKKTVAFAYWNDFYAKIFYFYFNCIIDLWLNYIHLKGTIF